MIDFNKLLASISGSGVGAGLAGGVAGGAVVSALATKSGRKTAKSVIKIGGLAAVGALAWSAYKKYQGDNAIEAQTATAQPGPQPSPAAWQQIPQEQFDALAYDQANYQTQGMLVLQTMISAAMVDGHLGPEEQKRIFERLDSLGLSAEERSLLFDELRDPKSCSALAAQVSDPVLAIEVYTAALMTVDASCVAARNFLCELAESLKLPDALLTSIHSNASTMPLVKP